ncbi:hypothetical protein ACFLXX_04215 [Chloroflexota bacterium]
MTISEKQIKANRENGKKGGVKTEEGKLRSRLNSVKHGMLLTSQMLLQGEDVKRLAKFQRKVISELVPYGELELLLVDRFITCAWRLRRVISVEKDSILGLYKKRDVKSPELLAYDKRIAELLFLNGHSVEKILRYETAREREMYKAIDKLIELQGKRIK